MIFQRNITINSPLTADEIKTRISEITRQNNTEPKHSEKFEGELYKTDFKLYPLFDYGPRNQLRPEILGKILDQKSSCRLNLVFGLAKSIKIYLFPVLILNIVVSYYISTEIPFFWLADLIAIFGFIIIGQFFFNSKVNKSLRILKTTVEATDATDTK